MVPLPMQWAQPSEALRQSADGWAHCIGSGTIVQIPTFGVLAHGIRTGMMDVNKFKGNRARIFQDNRPFTPQVRMRH